MTEAVYSRKLRAALERRFGSRIYMFKVHGNWYQRAGVPDIIGFLDGRGFGLELKQPGKTATPLQERNLGRIRAAGGAARVVVTTEPVEAVIGWLSQYAS